MKVDRDCNIHQKKIEFMCLAEGCKEGFLLCEECKETSKHKHSTTEITKISEIKLRLEQVWSTEDSIMQSYFKKLKVFYDSLKKQIIKLIDEDQNIVQKYLTKLKYHHLPLEANTHVYLEFLQGRYQQLDRPSILKLINEAEHGSLNTNMERANQIANLLDIELSKIKDKVATLRYVLPSKKIETQLLSPILSEKSNIADDPSFTKIYSLFNSRKMLVRFSKLIYSASQHNFDPKVYYNRCNGVADCLAIVKTANGKVLGGYSPLPFVHHDEQQMKEDDSMFQQDNTKRSFIFSLTNLKSFSLKDAHKAIVYRRGSIGPSFSEDLVLGRIVTSNLGKSYEGAAGVDIDSMQAKVYLLETNKSQSKDFQIWQLSF